MSQTAAEPNMTARLAGVWERQWEEDPLGCAEDLIDRTTRVVWTQSPCGIYVDLRLPAGAPGTQSSRTRDKRPEALLARGFDNGDYTEEELTVLLQQKSFAGRLQCSLGDTSNGQALKEDKILADLAKSNAGPLPLCTCFWIREIDYQPPTGGLDIGVCASSPMKADGTVDMRETGDDASYAEGWRRTVGTSKGPFVALELVSEDGKERKGFWVRTGNRFAYAVGRPEDAASAASLGCNPLSSKVKDCKSKSLAHAVKFLANDKDEEIAIALSYVAIVGQVEDNGSWRIDASNLAELVGCILIGGNEMEQFCCSTLSVASDKSQTGVGEGTLVDQKIPTKNNSDVVRRWKIVELSSSAALPLV